MIYVFDLGMYVSKNDLSKYRYTFIIIKINTDAIAHMYVFFKYA